MLENIIFFKNNDIKEKIQICIPRSNNSHFRILLKILKKLAYFDFVDIVLQ